METTPEDAFADSLAGIGVGVTRAGPETVAETITDLVTRPAIGVPFEGFDGVSLDETPVETEVTPRRLREANTGVTPTAGAIGEYGSLLVRSDRAGTEPVSLYPPNHVAVVRESDIVLDTEASVDRLDSIFGAGGSVVFATGASSTGDMGALVTGVHGPKEVHVVVLEDR